MRIYQNVKKNKAKIFDLEQLLQKIEIEIDNEEKKRGVSFAWL